ncbi:hypothetical protein SNE40_017878 [Patella caerulea]|uniref:Uncharacterized protein n=1 Tax=Patella caerulea TaxID=87958 RepID=A0AAN8PN10_PATCE
MLSCVPNGVPSNNSTSVLMWNTVICDGKIDCLDGSDESIEMCQQSQGGASFKTSYISYGIVACSIVLVIVGSFLALRIHLKQVKEQRNIVIRRNENADSIYSMRIDTMESEDLKTRPVSTIEEEPEYIIAELSHSFPGSSTCQSCSDLHVMPLNGTSTRADNKDSLHFVDDNGIKHTEL